MLKNARILVTGGNGFLGGYVSDRLRDAFNATVFAPRQKEVDLTNFHQAKGYFASIQPDIIFHLAAKVGGIEANRLEPGTFFRDNMQMGINILELARVYKTRKVVITGTVCAYPKFAPIPFKEDDLWNGYPEETNAPYGVAKKALLVMAQAYRKEFGLNTVMLLPVNLYGPRDHFDPVTSHVIPAMIRKFLEAKECGDKEVVLWGDGSPTREFLYIEDAADGIVTCAETYDDADPVNLGSGEEISISALAQIVKRHVGYEGAIVWDTSKPNGQPRRKLDTSRALERFNWQATTTFEVGLKTTIDWYKGQSK